MKRVFRGFVPKDYAFFHNLLFSLVKGDGIEKYMNGWYDKDGQPFKITIIIERTDD